MSAKSRRSSGAAEGSSAPSKVKAACEECRVRKTKCDGARPTCGRCLAKSRRCVYETEPDEFRITALKGRYSELMRARSTSAAFVQLLREKEREEAVEILDRLRVGESVESILAGNDREPSDEDERNLLMAAIEGARISEATDCRPPSDLSRSAEQRSDLHEDAPQTNVDRQSIAFLLDTEQPSDDPSPVEGSIVSDEGGREENADLRAPHPPQEKRTRVHGPHRPSIQTSPQPIPPPLPPTTGLREQFASMPSSTDRAWKKGLYGVKAADWQVYYADDETFLDIIKCYFVWENPSLGFVNETAFWEGLRSAGSDFCNPPLVHSVVAFGSRIYSLIDPSRAARAMHFAPIEIMKLWDWDADATVPANVSAGLLIHVLMTINGQEKDGTQYVSGAMNLANESGLFSSTAAYPHSNSEISMERAVFAWNVYAYQGYYTLIFNEPPMLSAPPAIDEPPKDPDGDSVQWSPFPLRGSVRPLLSGIVWRARAGLWSIASEILPLHNSFDNALGGAEHWSKAGELHKRLVEWRSGLNHRLNSLHGAAPHVFILHFEYYRCIIDTWRPFVKAQPGHASAERYQEARGRIDECHQQLRTLVHSFDMEFPGMPIPIKMLLNPLLYVVNNLLPPLKVKGKSSDEAFYFNLCFKMMSRMQDAYPLMRFFIFDIKHYADEQGVMLPKESAEMVEALMKSRSALEPGNSIHPHALDSRTIGVEKRHFQSLIGKTAGLMLGEESQSRGGLDESPSTEEQEE